MLIKSLVIMIFQGVYVLGHHFAMRQNGERQFGKAQIDGSRDWFGDVRPTLQFCAQKEERRQA